MRLADEEHLAEQLLQQNRILVDKIATALSCEFDEVPMALREVVRFLVLVSKYESGKLTPSHRVDLAWHEFILCTKAYGRFCETYLGRFVHHDPGGTEEDNKRQFRETLRRYEQRYGPPCSQYWGTDNSFLDCGSCEAI